MMEKEKGKRRFLKMIIMIADQKYRYTKKELAERYNVSESSIKKDIQLLNEVGFTVKKNEQGRYGFEIEKPFSKMDELLHFSEEDQLFLFQAIQKQFPNDKRGERVLKKINSLYDYHQLGLAALRKPYLRKIDLLKEAQSQKKVVLIKNYHSSHSNKISDRLVEPFVISPDMDILQAYDLGADDLRHFRITRMGRVIVKEKDWEFEKMHIAKPMDPFRIVDDNQVFVHLKLKVGAYNELIERFPNTKSHIEPSAEEDGIYDFTCKVNHRFYGLTNFILGYHHQLIEIVGGDLLIEHLVKQVEAIKEKLR